MPRIDLSFLIVATLSLLIGAVVGIWMDHVQGLQVPPAHIYVAILGWASLVFFGLTYRVYPELGRSWMALPHCVLASASGVLLPMGIALSLSGITHTLAAFTAFIWLASVILFLMNLVRIALASPAGPLRRTVPRLGGSSAPGSAHGFRQWRESL